MEAFSPTPKARVRTAMSRYMIDEHVQTDSQVDHKSEASLDSLYFMQKIRAKLCCSFKG